MPDKISLIISAPIPHSVSIIKSIYFVFFIEKKPLTISYIPFWNPFYLIFYRDKILNDYIPFWNGIHLFLMEQKSLTITYDFEIYFISIIIETI